MSGITAALRAAVAAGDLTGLLLARRQDGRWQASRRNADGSYYVHTDAAAETAVLEAIRATPAPAADEGVFG